jgi:23S rRNA (uracil1939-C5)-methyltransferase
VSAPGPGDRATVRIEKAVAGGRMLARAEGAILLVSGALPGELVEVRVERSQRGTIWAEAARIVEPSPHRVGEPNPCGGCVLAHASYAHQLTLKQGIVQDACARIARLPVELPAIVPSPPEGYRMRARLHVSGGRIGFYVEGTHRLCPPGPTGQLLPETLAAIDAVGTMLAALPDTVTSLELAENRDASERAIHLELAPEADPSRLGAIAGVPGITSLSLSHQRSPRIRVLSGEGRVTDRFSGADAGKDGAGSKAWSVSRSTTGFFQGNRYLLEPLIEHVLAALGTGPIMDLYAGAGLFAIAAAARGHAPVIAVEGDALSAADLRRNTAEWRGLIQAKHEPVESHLQNKRTIRPGTLIVDPPRTGLSAAAQAGISALRPPRIVYVSCDAPTLARDVRALSGAGYQLRQLTTFDLFPNTAHVESVAVLEQ